MTQSADEGLNVAEKVDRVPGQPAVTAWKRAARRHQNEWRIARGLGPGIQPSPKKSKKSPRKIGSRIDDTSAAAGMNFLTEDVIAAVKDRLDHTERFQTLDTRRLYGDLLSSMPMCFNLFGPLAVRPDLARKVTYRWFPDLCPADADVRVRFEWSPGRCQAEWLDDRTAFDAVIFINAGSQRRLIGIETKYHEHPVAEPLVRKNRKTRLSEKREPKPRYLEVNAKAGLCSSASVMANVWGAPVEQLWRDHLLALACQQHPTRGWAQTGYVLVAPAGNPAWPSLAHEYLALAPRAAETFKFRTIEELLDMADGLLPHGEPFRDRYLNVAVDTS